MIDLIRKILDKISYFGGLTSGLIYLGAAIAVIAALVIKKREG